MKPIEFDGCNVVVAANQPPYQPLPGHFVGGKVGTLLTCWELTDEELEEVIRTRRIWNVIMTFDQPLQPHCLSTDRPVVQAPLIKLDEDDGAWNVHRVSMKDPASFTVVEGGENLSKEAALDYARDLNTHHRASQMTHYYRATPAS